MGGAAPTGGLADGPATGGAVGVVAIGSAFVNGLPEPGPFAMAPALLRLPVANGSGDGALMLNPFWPWARNAEMSGAFACGFNIPACPARRSGAFAS